MNRVILSLALLLVFPLVNPQDAAASSGQMEVVLEGTVFTADGLPLAARTVFAFPAGEGGEAMVIAGITDDGMLTAIDPDAHPHAVTDANGRFRIVYSDSIAVEVSDDTFILAGKYSGVAVGVLAGEDLRSLPAFAQPQFLTPRPGDQTKPVLKIDGRVLVIWFGDLLVPE